MTRNNTHRELVDWVQTEYRIKPKPTIQYGGKHPYLKFYYLGRDHRITISATPCDIRYINNAKRQIKQKLGVPLIPLPPAKRKLNEMLNDLLDTGLPKPLPQEQIMTETSLTTHPPKTPFNPVITKPLPFFQPGESNPGSFRGTVACYQSNKTVNFIFPQELVEHIDRNITYTALCNNDQGYQIKPSPQSIAHPRQLGKNRKKQVIVISMSKTGDKEYFGATKCEFLVMDNNQILVSLLEPRQPVAPLNFRYKHKRILQKPPVGKFSNPKPPDLPLMVDIEKQVLLIKLLKTALPGDRTTMEAVLDYLIRTQKTTMWRLVEIGENDWRFRDDIKPKS